MSAKKQYLPSDWRKLSKIFAIIFGAYAAISVLHLALWKIVSDNTIVLLISVCISFLVWIGLTIIAYIIRREPG
ncbi:MAG: hypothetical protein AAF600_04730 [Bacteroidota bacterium]